MAATVLKALGDLYETVSPALPSLWSGDQPEGTARTFPNAAMIHLGTVPNYQRGKGKNGASGIKFETTRVTFKLWYAGSAGAGPTQNGFDAADLASEALMAAMTPLVLAVTGAQATVLKIDKKTVNRDGTRGSQGQFVFRADVDVTAQVDY